MQHLNDWVPLGSLVVAALAVFFGPLIQSRISRRQVETTLKAANKQILAPMRQQWIESLRDLVAGITTEAYYYYIASGPEDEDAGAEKNDQARQRMMLSEQKIRLLLNMNEPDHQALADQIRLLVACATADRPGREFGALHQAVTELARRVFKREWDRVKPRARKTMTKVTQMFIERRNLAGHMFYTGGLHEWHFFSFDQNDLVEGTRNHWKGGAHVHFINWLWPHINPREMWAQFTLEAKKPNSALHIRHEVGLASEGTKTRSAKAARAHSTRGAGESSR